MPRHLLRITVIPMPTMSFKVTAEEAARIRQLARREKRTVSEFIRRRAVQREAVSTGDTDYRIAISRVTGLPVMQAPPGAPRVTSEDVAALLTEFP